VTRQNINKQREEMVGEGVLGCVSACGVCGGCGGTVDTKPQQQDRQQFASNAAMSSQMSVTNFGD
jgi:hypothetical protein